MSRYGTALYGAAVYGAGISGVYDATPMTATVLDAASGQVRVSWTIPNGDFTRLMLVRGKFGIPDNPDREASKQLLDIDYSPGSTDENQTLAFYYETGLAAGSEVYYAVYVWGADSEAVGGYRWFLAGAAGTVIPNLHNSAEDLRSLLPAAFFSPTGGHVEGPESADSLLYSVAEAVGYNVDAMRTDLDRLLRVYDADRCPTSLVSSMSAHLGIGGESALPTRVQRSLNKNAVSIFTHKGSADSIRMMTEALSGLDAYVSPYYNLLPNPFVSGFEQGVGDVITGVLTDTPTVVSSMLHTASVSGLPGYPVQASSDPARLSTAPVIGVLTNALGEKQHIAVLERNSTGSSESLWDYVPGLKATESAATFGSGSTLSVNINGTGWGTGPGFVAEIESPGLTDPPNPPYDVLTETEALFTPLMDWRLRLTCLNSAYNIDMRYGTLNWIVLAETYPDRDALLVTDQCHGYQQGDSVTVTVGDLDIDGRYTVTEVIDSRRLRINFRSDAFAAHSPSSSLASHIDGPDFSRVIQTEPAELYSLSFWVLSNVEATVYPEVVMHDARLEYDDVAASSVDIDADTWTRVSLVFTARQYASLRVTITGLSEDDYALIDNIMVATASDPEKYVDGGNVLVQLASTITSDANGVLRLRLKDRLREVTGSGRTHTVLLVTDKYLDIDADTSMILTYSPLERYFDLSDPTTVTALDQDVVDLTSSRDITYVPGYDPEQPFRVGTQDVFEVLIRGDLVLSTSPSSEKVVAEQVSAIDPDSGYLWRVTVSKPTSGTLEVKAYIDNGGIILTGTVPYAADTSRWYRLRSIASTTNTFADGATSTLSHADDSLSEPSSWSLLDTDSTAFSFDDVPGDIRVGSTTDGTNMRLYDLRVSQIASFNGNDFNTETNTAINPLGEYESSTWNYTP